MKARETESPETDDLPGRFPDLDHPDLWGKGPAIPDPPAISFERPAAQKNAPRRSAGGLGVGMQEAAGMSRAMAAGSALLGSIAGGVIVGALTDHYLLRQETPWGLISGVLLGIVSGFANLLKITGDRP